MGLSSLALSWTQDNAEILSFLNHIVTNVIFFRIPYVDGILFVVRSRYIVGTFTMIYGQ